ncbi:hypothetical protein CHU95_11345 [Niveispirillum lacus]|uniref:Uncharacterized protein n=1 Tax=Niveispirillum lacus TaxID=1981099 RepID=A0A255Z0X7_9PROT|nr:hypothetical protein [Niveispirillum lacus]OYQ34594.1 hypothetical protein CHU95_11345 [Niveispirillum lacus]
MDLLLEALHSGWITVVAILILWTETVALSVIANNPRRRFRVLWANACSGTCLLAALGLALRDSNSIWIMALLAGSLVAHAIDILMRGGNHRRAFSRKTE